MTVTTVKSHIGKEDLQMESTVALPTESFTRKISTGATISLTKLPNLYKGHMSVYNAKSFSPYTLTKTAIDAALAEITDDADGCVYLEPGNWVIDDDLTFGTNILLWFEWGAYMTIASGKVVTINGDIRAPYYNIFQGSGTVTWGTAWSYRLSRWEAVGDATSEYIVFNAMGFKVMAVDATTTCLHSMG